VGGGGGGSGVAPARRDDADERAPVDDQILDDREGPGTPWLENDRGAVLEVPHVQLARRGARSRPVRPAVDHDAARATDAFAAIVVEGDGIRTLLDQPLVHDI